MQRITQVDSFTDKPFAGNPAGVCILAKARDEPWMRSVAREMNLAETAFLQPREDGSFDLRWFTPAVEVDLCGHATLASAHVLWESGQLRADQPARFHTRSGLLTCNERDGWIEMDFPATPPKPIEPPAGLFEALGIPGARFVGRSRFDGFVELEDEATLRAVQPDFGRLKRVDARGVIITARASTKPYDFVSRFFAPQSGVDEDPVTGSAHCTLGPFWASRLGKRELLACQASARGGVVRVRVEGDRVKLGGQAVTVLQGRLLAG
jgi:PhzF family phenazine biosynthesis protein